MNLSPAAEREALTAFLDKQRDILVRKIEGLVGNDAMLADEIEVLKRNLQE